jgi:hypothetical protein
VNLLDVKLMFFFHDEKMVYEKDPEKLGLWNSGAKAVPRCGWSMRHVQ